MNLGVSIDQAEHGPSPVGYCSSAEQNSAGATLWPLESSQHAVFVLSFATSSYSTWLYKKDLFVLNAVPEVHRRATGHEAAARLGSSGPSVSSALGWEQRPVWEGTHGLKQGSCAPISAKKF